jgi:hypothetical protein
MSTLPDREREYEQAVGRDQCAQDIIEMCKLITEEMGIEQGAYLKKFTDEVLYICLENKLKYPDVAISIRYKDELKPVFVRVDGELRRFNWGKWVDYLSELAKMAKLRAEEKERARLAEEERARQEAFGDIDDSEIFAGKLPPTSKALSIPVGR